MHNPFTAHPHAVHETYLQHAAFAGGVGFKMIGAGIACCLHGIFPFLFTTTASRTILALAAMLSSGHRRANAERITAGMTVAAGMAAAAGMAVVAGD